MCKRFCKALQAAFGLYSVLPAGRADWDDANAGLLLACFPLVGGGIGALWYAAARLLALWQPPLLLHGALLCLTAPLLTGFFHLDGFSDVMDAVCSRRPQAERQRILKDPHLGAFGAMGLCVWAMLSWASACGAVEKHASLLPFLLIPVLSRCVCGLLLLRLPLLAQSGYAAYYRQHTSAAVQFWLGALGALCLAGSAVAGPPCFLPLASLLVGSGLSAWGACRSLGGVNGDVAGWALTVGEACALFCMTCL